MRYWDILSKENVGEFENNLSLTDILERKSKLDALEQLNNKIKELKKQIKKKNLVVVYNVISHVSS